ncbi:MAG: 50S ribosomal protein L22, partial [Planctomycetia bacterium]|nr:50S ribosomal protein L22 [Planctomycetia bacterium]
MDYKAKHRFADVGPRKIRLFANLVRGRNVDEALQLLQFYPNRGAKLLRAVIQSAYGNANDKECTDPDGLIITECRVDGAPMFKRIQPRARGTAFSIKRRMSHIIVTLSEPIEETPDLEIPPPIDGTGTTAPTPETGTAGATGATPGTTGATGEPAATGATPETTGATG